MTPRDVAATLALVLLAFWDLAARFVRWIVRLT